MSRRSPHGTPTKRRTLKIRSGDQVKVMAGKDRGKSGRVLRVEPAKERVYVEGLNMVKRHIRPQQIRPARPIADRGSAWRRDRASRARSTFRT